MNNILQALDDKRLFAGALRDKATWLGLTTTPQPFGGQRWWFICPRTGRRTAKLYLPDGALTFASRQAYRLAYQCQRNPSRPSLAARLQTAEEARR